MLALTHPAQLGLERGDLRVSLGEGAHHVRSLDTSISLAVNAFTRPNNFNWYKPGAPG